MLKQSYIIKLEIYLIAPDCSDFFNSTITAQALKKCLEDEEIKQALKNYLKSFKNHSD